MERSPRIKKLGRRIAIGVAILIAFVVIANVAALGWMARAELDAPTYARQDTPLALRRTGSSAQVEISDGIAMHFSRIELEGTSRGLWVARHETTNQQFGVFVDHTGYRTMAEREGFAWSISGSDFVREPGLTWASAPSADEPRAAVTIIAWADAVAFANWLSSQTHRRVRLPTSAEWGALCRASDNGALGPLEERAWIGEEVSAAQPVGTRAPDVFGLYDLFGNVWEWQDDGLALPDIRRKPLAGGSWLNDAELTRCDLKATERAGIREPHIGFRVVIEGE